MRLWTAALGAVLAMPAVAAVDALVYRGEISAERNAELFAQVRDLVEAERLVMTSGGGSVKAGIALGRWVREQGLTLVIEDYCLSSCANYVFTAALRKRIRPGAVVGWHGNYRHLLETGLWREDAAGRMVREGEDRATALRRAREYAEELVALEKAFFEQIGVNEYLCWFGKLPPYGSPDYYTVSVMDMARFGVKNVYAPPDYPDAAALGQVENLRYIRLEEMLP